MEQLSAHHDKRLWVHYQAALKVARLLKQRGFEAYLIGGAVRDLWLGISPKDFDIVTNARPEQLVELPGLDSAKHTAGAQAFGVTRLRVEVDIRGHLHQSEVEVTTYRRDIEAHLGRKATRVEFADLAEDVARRDFTINALALDLANNFVVDLVGGIDDLEAGVVRFIGDGARRIREDPLRILRGVRLKVQYDFRYAPATDTAIKAAIAAGQTEQIAQARLKDELSRMFTHPTRQAALLELDQLGVIGQLLPELAATKGVKQPPEFHIEGDVWRHTILAMGYLPAHTSSRLAWATLLHDIGKPPTFQPVSKTGDRIRFSEHYRVGAQLARQILKRLGFSNKFVNDIEWMIENHLGIDNLPQMRPARAKNFMSHPAFTDLLELHKADARASWHLLPDGRVSKPRPTFGTLQQMWADFQAEAHLTQPTLKSELGIDGNWLKANFKISKGPVLGDVLAKLHEAYLDGELKNTRQAKQLVAQWLKSAG